jgi:hypothetical protein
MYVSSTQVRTYQHPLANAHAYSRTQGGFSAAIGAAAMALSNPNRQLKYHLYVLLREHLHAVQGASKQLSQQAQLVRDVTCNAVPMSVSQSQRAHAIAASFCIPACTAHDFKRFPAGTTTRALALALQIFVSQE